MKIVERLCDGYFMKYVEIKCDSCKHNIYFKLEMLDYCTALHCHYCKYRIEVKDIKVE